MDIIEKLGITPGPWGISFNNSIKGVFDGRNGDDGWYNGPDDCDIKLISAAPELLEVVIELMACSEYWSEYDVPLGIHDRIKNAVEKATGRTDDEVMEMYNE